MVDIRVVGMASVLLAGCGGEPLLSLGRTHVNYGGDFGGTVRVAEEAVDGLDLANTGEGELVVEAVELSGDAAARFRVARAPTRLAAGGKERLEVVVAPTSPGRLRATLLIRSNAKNGVAEVQLEATAVARDR